MAANLNYQFNFVGLDANIAKLKEALTLVKQLAGAGGLANSINVNVKQPQAPNKGISPTEAATVGSISAKSGQGVGGANLAKIFERDFIQKQIENLEKQIELASDFQSTRDRLQPVIERWQRKLSELMMPPPLPPTPRQPTGFLSAFKNQYKEPENSVLSTIRKGANSGKVAGNMGMLGGSLGALATKYGAVTLALGALGIASYTLKQAFEVLKEGVEAGSRAYQEAARHGMDVYKNTQIQNAAKAIGIDNIDLTLLQSQLSGGKKGGAKGSNTIPDTDIILSSARAGQLGNSQQIVNMAEEFRKAMQDGANSAIQMALYAKALQDSSQKLSNASREWSTLMSGLATMFSSLMDLFTDVWTGLLEKLNETLMMINMILMKLGLITPPSEKKNEKLTPTGAREPVNQLGRIGMVMTGNGGTINNQIANNTANTYKGITQLINIFEKAFDNKQNKFNTTGPLTTVP